MIGYPKIEAMAGTQIGRTYKPQPPMTRTLPNRMVGVKPTSGSSYEDLHMRGDGRDNGDSMGIGRSDEDCILPSSVKVAATIVDVVNVGIVVVGRLRMNKRERMAKRSSWI